MTVTFLTWLVLAQGGGGGKQHNLLVHLHQLITLRAIIRSWRSEFGINHL